MDHKKLYYRKEQLFKIINQYLFWLLLSPPLVVDSSQVTCSISVEVVINQGIAASGKSLLGVIKNIRIERYKGCAHID